MEKTTSKHEFHHDPVMVQTYQGHKDTITALSFHPTMRQIVSGSMDNTIYIWGLKPKSKAYRFMGHKGPIYDVEFSPNGALIASCSKDETVKIWNNTIEGNSNSIKAHNGAVRSVNFSSDGQLLLSSSDDKTIKIWSVNDKRFQFSLLGHSNWVRTARFSPDNRLVVSGGDDKCVKIWDTDKKQEIHSFTDHTGVIYNVKFHPDGTCVASCGHDKKIKIFDVRSKRLLQHYDAHNDNVNQLAFHPSGSFLISSSADAKVKIWDLRYGKLAYTLFGHDGSSTACTFSYHGDYFATGGGDSLVMLWKSNFLDSNKEHFEELGAVTNVKKSESLGGSKNLPKSVVQSRYNSKKLVQTSVVPKEKENIGPNVDISSPGKQILEEINETGESSLKKHTEKQVKSVISWDKNEIPPSIVNTLETIVNQLDCINKTLQVFEMRVSNNEEQISMINRTLNRDFDKIPAINENLYNISLKKDSRLTKEIVEKVSFQEKASIPNIITFNPAP